MNEWQQVKLVDVCVKNGVQTGPFGSQLHQKDYVDIGTPIITVEHLGDNRITMQNLPRVSHEDKERLSKYTLQEGDIVFSRVGSVDRRAYVRKEQDGWLFSGRCLRVRPDTQKIDPYYLSAYFGLPSFKEYVRSIAVGATMPSLNTTLLENVPVILPPKKQQELISHTAKTIEDKIELNHWMSETLEAMTRALFKSWFVDFDPVRAKAEGRKPEGIDDATATLFPATFNDDGLPEGWSSHKVEDVLELSYGKALKKEERVAGNVPVYGSGGITGFHNEALVEGPGIIVGRKGTVGSLYWEPRKFYPIDTVFYVVPNKGYSLEYAYYLLQTLGLETMNTDAAVPGLNRNNAYRLNVAKTSPEIIAAFTKTISVWRDLIDSNIRETSMLENIRDALLPKLISGELKINDAESERGK